MNFIGSTAKTVAMISSVLWRRPDTVINPSLLPHTNTSPPYKGQTPSKIEIKNSTSYNCLLQTQTLTGPRKPKSPVRTYLRSPITDPSGCCGWTCGGSTKMMKYIWLKIIIKCKVRMFACIHVYAKFILLLLQNHLNLQIQYIRYIFVQLEDYLESGRSDPL